MPDGKPTGSGKLPEHEAEAQKWEDAKAALEAGAEAARRSRPIGSEPSVAGWEKAPADLNSLFWWILRGGQSNMRLGALAVLASVSLAALGCGRQVPAGTGESVMLSEKQISAMVSEAAGIPPETLRAAIEMEAAPPLRRLENQSLTAVLLFGSLTTKSTLEEFQAKGTVGPGTLVWVANGLLAQAGKDHSNASLIRPAWVTKVTRTGDTNRTTGTVSFDSPYCTGEVHYIAESRAGAWRIVELSMPDSGVVTRIDAAGRWRADLSDPWVSGSTDSQ